MCAYRSSKWRATISRSVNPCAARATCGNIDAAFFHVARDVLPEIRELQSRAGVIRKPLPLFISVVAKIKHQSSDRIRGIDAIIEHVVPGRVPLHRLILPECAQQIGERRDRNFLGTNCLRKRDQHRVRRQLRRNRICAAVLLPTNRAALARAPDRPLRRPNRPTSGSTRTRYKNADADGAASSHETTLKFS